MLIRRSNLLVPLEPLAIASAWEHDADAVTLDVAALAEGELKTTLSLVPGAITTVARGGAEVFIRMSCTAPAAVLSEAVRPGVRGIVLTGVRSASDVEATDEQVTGLERERKLQANGIEFVLLIGSALGVWNLPELVRASTRVTEIGLDEGELVEDEQVTPLPDIDPFVYARGRLAIEATAARVRAVGAVYPLSVEQRAGSCEQVHAMAISARNSGMKGMLCPHPSWVVPVNQAFTPTPDRVEWSRRVREAFAEGLARGTAAVPLDGRMIDVPVDEWAAVVLATSEACAARDDEKAAARRSAAMTASSG